ncbi:GH1 family beta-glucosidase [Rarobacter faecitabidus]|uniref:Beta-glucosidase n=1 Tax=Rarobacter faecitabidus TaxID=13243 RepID=A0A542ZU19_RARFA|nr:GH1 family beta-glucosidase [Rarobacter faecitabidus]TQL63854.1 beta-glucosidase [Rarobacter faecitabidus]
MTVYRFPENFLWGAATASYQVEGAAHIDGRKPSIWDTFSAIPGAVMNGDNGDIACDQYHRYPEDVALMRDLAIGAYRFSVSWARVRPDGASGPGGVNRSGLDYYSRLVDELLSNDIEPWLTLYHWDLPQALEDRGGWTNRDIVQRFVEFSLTVHDALGDRVRSWTTLNEPWCSAFLGYTGGVHAPGRMDGTAGLVAAHHLLLGHGEVTRELRRAAPDANLGITLNFTVADPADPSDPADLNATRLFDAQFNRLFLDPLFRGEYPADLLADLRTAGRHTEFEAAIKDGDLETISTPIDSLGVNYYHGELVSARPDPNGISNEAPVERPVKSPFVLNEDLHVHMRDLPRTDQNWEIQPEGLTRLLTRLHREYLAGSSVLMYITENGAAFDDVMAADGRVNDTKRLEFIRSHLIATHAAIEQGAPVVGYFAWSLLDNFEWAWGYAKRFGIVYVDFDTQVRTVKASGRWYAETSAANAVTST